MGNACNPYPSVDPQIVSDQKRNFTASTEYIETKNIEFTHAAFYKKKIELKGMIGMAHSCGITYGATGADNPLHVVIVLSDDKHHFITESNSSGIRLRNISAIDLNKELKDREYLEYEIDNEGNEGGITKDLIQFLKWKEKNNPYDTINNNCIDFANDIATFQMPPPKTTQLSRGTVLVRDTINIAMGNVYGSIDDYE